MNIIQYLTVGIHTCFRIKKPPQKKSVLALIKYDAGFTKSYVNNLWMKAKPRAKVYFESGVGRVHQASQIRVICEIRG